MPTILCLDFLTCGLAEAARVSRENGCRVRAAHDNSGAVQIEAETHLDAVLLTATASATMPGLWQRCACCRPRRHRHVLGLLRRAVLSALSGRRLRSEGRDARQAFAHFPLGCRPEPFRILPFRRGMKSRQGRHHSLAPNNERSAETCSGEAHHGEMDRTNHDIRDVRRFRIGRDCRLGGCILSGDQLAGYKAVHVL
jgi:hypothetical protein